MKLPRQHVLSVWMEVLLNNNNAVLNDLLPMKNVKSKGIKETGTAISGALSAKTE